MLTKNLKKIMWILHKCKGYKQTYNYAKFGSTINQKLSQGILKIRSRSYSQHRFSLKFKFCRRCFSFKVLQRHHPDYNEPRKIIILCRKCHWKCHTK